METLFEIDDGYVKESSLMIYDELTSEAEDQYSINCYIEEKTHKSLGQKFNDVISAIVMSFKNLIHDIKMKIEEKANSKEFKEKIERELRLLETEKRHGVRQVKIVDLNNYRAVYKKLNDQLHKYVKRFATISYSNTIDLEEDLQKFDNIILSYKEKTEEALNHTITISIDKAIEMKRNELSGKSKYIHDLEEELKRFREYEHAADRLRTMYSIKGEGVLPKHHNFLLRIINKISSVIRRAIVKAVTTVVFLFS